MRTSCAGFATPSKRLEIWSRTLEEWAGPEHALPAYLRLDGPNQWLPEEVLPGFRAIVEDVLDRLAWIADELMGALAVGLGLPEDAFRVAFGERPLSLAKLISYPPTPDGEAGVNSHHDAGFLTVLLQHGVGGLEALNQDGEWIPVPPTRGALVINLGEMLQSMTGNFLVATTHRVISREQRYSSAYFHGPDLRAGLGPLDLDPRFAEAVAASPHHREAGFMARRDELLAGGSETDPVALAQGSVVALALQPRTDLDDGLPLPGAEGVEKILVVKKEEVKPQFRLGFEENDVVRIISGPFADFNGTISEINVDQSKLKVLVNIFDRETPVELGFDQVSKV